MTTPTWGIVMTAHEPGDLVLANVAYHLGVGATEAHLYLDDPADPIAPILRAVPGCFVTICDAAHWAHLTGLAGGGRPIGQNRRQGLNATQAYQKTNCDWLLHLDADEFLSIKGDFRAELAGFTRDSGYIICTSHERIFRRDEVSNGIFDGGFRMPTNANTPKQQAIFGKAARFLKSGMSSHTIGKSITPTGFDYQIRIHRPRAVPMYRNMAHAPRSHTGFPAQTAHLLHFDGLTPLHWILKMLRYKEYDPETVAKHACAAPFAPSVLYV